MRVMTFSTLRTAIQVRYDLPAFSTTTKPTTTQVNALINASAARLSALLCQCFGDDYFTTTAGLVTSADNSLLQLPAAFYKLRSLIWLRATDDPVEIRRATIADYASASLLAARSWLNEAPLYRFSGASYVWLLPRPNAVYSLTCTYVQTPADLSADGDTVDAGPGWEEWIVNDACVKLAQIREEDPSVYMSERSDCEQRIRSQAPDRDETEPMAVRDVMGAAALGNHQMRDWLTRYG